MELIQQYSAGKPTLVVRVFFFFGGAVRLKWIFLGLTFPFCIEFFKFCATRKSASSTAEQIVREAHQLMLSNFNFSSQTNFSPSHPFVKTQSQYDALVRLKSKFSDSKMGECIVSGVCFHHAGKLIHILQSKGIGYSHESVNELFSLP